MKRFLSILLLAFSLSSAFGAITYDSSVPDALISFFDREYKRAVDGREKIDVTVTDYKEEQLEEGIYLTSNYSAGNDDVKLEGFGSSLEDAYSSIAGSLYSMLYYNEELYSKESMILEYAYNGSYSAKDTGFRRGQRLALYDSEDKIRGIFLISDHYNDYDNLKPLYINKALPGMKLKRVSSFDWNLDYSLSLPIEEHYLSFSVGNTSWIYPFRPFAIASFSIDQLYRAYGIYCGIGLTAKASLSSMIPFSFTMIEEGSIGADAALLFSFTDRKFYGSYSIYYEHRAFSFLSWRIGYTITPSSFKAVTIGLGGNL